MSIFSKFFEKSKFFRKHDFSKIIEIPLKIEKSSFRKIFDFFENFRKFEILGQNGTFEKIFSKSSRVFSNQPILEFSKYKSIAMTLTNAVSAFKSNSELDEARFLS